MINFLSSWHDWMRAGRGLLAAWTMVLVVAVAPLSAQAQVTWDANTTTSGPQDGSGTWSTSDANWWNGTTDVVWPNLTTSSAIIGANNGAAGTITTSGSLTLNAITFNASGSGSYTITGGTLGFAGSSPTITANANATIESAITSGVGLTKSGTGTLTLAGIVSNTAGTMSINRGAVTLTGTLTNTSASTFAIGSANGGTLTIAGGTMSTSGGGARSLVIAGGAGQSGTVAVTSGFFSPVGMLVSEDSGGNGVFTQSGGTTTIGASSLWLTGNSSTLTVSGGSLTTPAMYTNFGNSNSATTINVSGSGSLTVNGNAQIGTGGRNGITLNVNVGDGTGGGLFQMNSFTWGGMTGTATINFNSGTFVGNATHSLPTQIATVVKSGGANISVASSQTLTMSSPLTDGGGGGGLRKLGAGTLSLTGSNTYTGTTSIAAGSLSIGNALALQNSTLDLNASDAGTVSAISQNSTLGGLTGSRNLDMLTRTLSIGNNNASTTYSGTLSNGSLTKVGAGTLTLTGSSTYSGTTTISGGTLQVGNGGTSGAINSTAAIVNNGSLVFDNNSNFTIAPTTGSGSLLASATTNGFIRLGGNITQSGSVSISTLTTLANSAGIRQSGNTTITASAISLQGQLGSFSNDSNFVLTLDTSATNGPILLDFYNGSTGRTFVGASSIVANSGTGTLTVGAQAGRFSESGAWPTATLTGGISITAAFAQGALSTGTGGFTLNATAPSTISSNLTLGGTSTNVWTVNPGVTMAVSGRLAGTGAAITKSGSGTLTLSGSNSYTGATTVNAGVVALSGSGILASTGTVAVAGSGATFDISGANGNRTIGALTGVAGSTVTLGTNSLTFGDSTSGTFAGSVGGTGGLTKAGAGTLVLSGSNSFSGGLTLTGGQVQVANASALGTGAFTTNVDAETTIPFNLATSAAVANNITINKPGSNRIYRFQQNQANNLTLAGNITMASGNTPVFQLNTGVTSGTFTLTGSNTFGNDLYTNANVTFRIGGTNAAGTGIWRPDVSTKMVLLDGANFRGVMGNAVASFSMETSGTATISGDVFNRNTANVAVNLPAGAQLTFSSNIRSEGGFTTGTYSKTGEGTWVVNNTVNQMTFNVLEGTMQVSSFSGIGPTSTASFLVLNGGTLRYTGAAASTAREFTLGANGGSLDASGSGSAAFTSTAAVAFAGAGNRTLTLAGTNTGNNTLAMAINDNGADVVSVLKTGAGTWVLSGSNSYSGSTTVSAGRLVVANANALGSGTATIGSGVLDVGSLAAAVGGFTITSGSLVGSGTLTSTTGYGVQSGSVLAGLAGSVALVKSTSGTVMLSGNNTYSGGTQIDAGTLQLGSSTALPTSSALTLGTGSTSGVLAFNGNTATLRSVTFNGSGSQLSGTASGGKLNLLASGTNNATITVTSGSHALHPDTTLQSNTVINVAAGSFFSLHGVIDGSKSLTQIGSGTVAIYGANSYSGGTYLNGGYLSVQNTGALGSGTVTIDGNSILNLNNTILANTVVFGSGSGAIINSGSLVNVTGTYSITSGTGTSITTNYSLQPGSSISFVDNLAATVSVQGSAVGTFSSDVLEAGTVIVNAGGRGTFNGGMAGNVTTSGSTIFSGDVLGNVTVSGGTATFTGATGVASAINVNSGLGVVTGTVTNIAHATAAGATLEIRGRVLSTADVNAEAGATVKLMGSQAFDGATLDNDGLVIVNRTANLTLAAVISGTGSLTKTDATTLTLTGNNTFTGLTTVSAGTLAVNGGLAGPVAVATGAVVGGSGVIGGTLSGAGLVSPGNSPGILTAGQYDATSGLDAAFEFTAFAPVYNASSASENDVLQLTSGSPFIGTLGGGNVINVYFNVDSIASGDSFEGGFFTGLSAGDLFSAVQNATFQYWIKDNAGTTPFGGVNYSTLTSVPGITGVTLSTAAVTRTFSSGNVSGSVTQFVIVPEPASLLLSLSGTAAAIWAFRRRR